MSNYKRILIGLLASGILLTVANENRKCDRNVVNDNIYNSQEFNSFKCYNIGVIRCYDVENDTYKYLMYDKRNVVTNNQSDLYIEALYTEDMNTSDVLNIEYKSIFDNGLYKVRDFTINYTKDSEVGMVSIVSSEFRSGEDIYKSFTKNILMLDEEDNSIKNNIHISNSTHFNSDKDICSEVEGKRMFQIDSYDLEKVLFENNIEVKEEYSLEELSNILEDINLKKGFDFSNKKTMTIM